MSMPKPTIKDLLVNAINGLTLAMKEIEAQYPEPGGLAHAIIKGAKPAEKPAPPLPDFDAMSDAEVMAWALGYRRDDHGNWYEPKLGWIVSQYSLPPINSFDDCIPALDAVFGRGHWTLERETDGYRLDDSGHRGEVAAASPTPIAAAVAAIRQAIKEREHA